MAEKKPPPTLNPTLTPALRAGLKDSIFSSASSPAIASMVSKQLKDDDLEQSRRYGFGASLAVPESPQKLQNSSSSSSISSWFRVPFERSMNLTADIEQYVENIPENGIHLGIDMKFLTQADADKTKKPDMLSKLDKCESSSKTVNSEANHPQMRYNVANFDLNAVGPSSW